MSEAGIPGELKKALAQRPAAQAAWDKLPPSHKAEYVKWIVEAKAGDARVRRASQAVAKLTGG
ncbi:MAG TPA: YdeI/OmpD-associated family protein [Caulobacteraceae bacterium]|nr:YdeI/OmpD-associated family protein [Caulobacteraceae bacterium]